MAENLLVCVNDVVIHERIENLLRLFAHVGVAHGVADRKHGARSDRELVHADGEEGFGQIQIGAQLAADALCALSTTILIRRRTAG